MMRRFPWPGSRPLRGRDVLFMLMLFFGVIFTVNGLFFWMAMRTYPGVETQSAYRDGQAYNRLLAEAETVAALGWRAGFEYLEDPAGATRIVIAVVDGAGSPLAGRDVRLELRRPVHDRADRVIAATEPEGGRYLVELPDLAGGAWHLTVRIRREAGPDFVYVDRLVVP